MSNLVFNFVCPAGGGDLTGTTFCFDVKDKDQAEATAEAAQPDAVAAPGGSGEAEPSEARPPQPALG